jgi:hypothetical protein
MTTSQLIESAVKFHSQSRSETISISEGRDGLEVGNYSVHSAISNSYLPSNDGEKSVSISQKKSMNTTLMEEIANRQIAKKH